MTQSKSGTANLTWGQGLGVEWSVLLCFKCWTSSVMTNKMEKVAEAELSASNARTSFHFHLSFPNCESSELAGQKK